MRSSTPAICSALGDRLEFSLGQLDREVDGALVARVDDRRKRAVAHEQPGDGLDRLLRGRQPDARGRCIAQGFESLERQREMGAALVARDRVDLVDDHRLDRAQRAPPARARHQEVQRLGRGDDEARWRAHEPRTFRGRRVAGADRNVDVGRVEPEFGCDFRDLPQRALQVLGDVDRERFQRRHVHNARDAVNRVAQLVRQVQAVDAHQERGERLARTGGCCDQRVVARSDAGPAVALRIGRSVGESPPEPSPTAGWNPSTGTAEPSVSCRGRAATEVMA